VCGGQLNDSTYFFVSKKRVCLSDKLDGSYQSRIFFR
jgi:hypothetical protein